MPVDTDDLRAAIPSLYPDNLNGEIDAARMREGQRFVADVIDEAIGKAYSDEAKAWAQSPTPPDPLDLTSKSSKTWAAASAASAAAALLDADRAEAAALTTPLYRQAFADLAAITPAQLAVGADVETPFGRYRRVGSGGHLNYSGTGGVRLDIMPSDSGAINFAATGAVSGDANHNALWAVALEAASDYEASEIRFPPGTFRISYSTAPTTNLLQDTAVVGARWLTVIKPVSSEDRACFGCDSGSSVAFMRGIRLSGITFMGSEATPTFSEQKHLVSLNGTDGVIIEDCIFVGWRGDAVYIGSADTAGVERHNKNVVIRRNVFDGVNRENRQGISFLDVDGAWVYDNVFQNCSKTTMPGPVDFEPNSVTYAVIKNIWVQRNKFLNCGGNAGHVSVIIPAAVAVDPVNINITDNVSEGSIQVAGGGFVYLSFIGRPVSNVSVNHAITIHANVVLNSTGSPFYLWNVKGANLRGNTYTDVQSIARVGLAGLTARDIRIEDTFIRSGSANAACISVAGDVSGLDMSGSIFDDCCSGLAGSTAVQFASGTSENVVIEGVTIVSPTGKTLTSFVKEVAHTFNPSTNRYFNNNRVSFGPGTFEAHYSDEIWTIYTPMVEGATAPGTGTYTFQFGRYRRSGKNVTFAAKATLTSHTSAGNLIELGLPTIASAATLNAETPISISLDGVATTGGQVGWINPAARVNSLGCVRCYHTATGVLAQTVIPAGTWTAQWAGNYVAE